MVAYLNICKPNELAQLDSGMISVARSVFRTAESEQP